MTKKSKMTLALASMLGITAGATAVSGFAWFTTTKAATVDITNIGVYSKSSALAVEFTSAVVGCTNNGSTTGAVSVIGASAASTTTDHFTGDGSNKTFNLKQYANAKPTVTVDGTPVAAGEVTLGTGANGKQVTLENAPGSGLAVEITYTPYAALTDVSSIDGLHIYKPTWTATGEGRYATAIPEISASADPAVKTGYIQFTMTLTANGSSDLKVYLNNPQIKPVNSTVGSPDIAAADLTRVAICEGSTTDLVIQKSTTSNKGIGSTFISAGKTADLSVPTDSVNDAFDLSTLADVVPAAKYAIPDSSDKSILSEAPDEDAPNNFVTTVTAGDSKVLTVTIWLEGTCGNTGSGPNGTFSASPENGMIEVNLPLIAF